MIARPDSVANGDLGERKETGICSRAGRLQEML